MTTFINWLNRPLTLFLLVVVFSVGDLIILGSAFELSKSDWASWVQAIGSVAAIGAALFIMDRQNKHTARLALESEHRGNMARAKVVGAIVENVQKQFDAALDPVVHFARLNSPDETLRRMKQAQTPIRDARLRLSTIPVYDLGIEEIAIGILEMIDGLVFFEKLIEEWVDSYVTNPNDGHRTFDIHYRSGTLRSRVNTGRATVRDSLAMLETAHMVRA
jgi:hypothetical protein